MYTDWTLETPPRPFYVGKGTQGRVRQIERNTVHKHIREKHGLIRYIELETDDEQEAFTFEVQLIQELRTYANHQNGWWGANLTLGGEGMSGFHLTKEQRQSISNRMRDRWLNEEGRQTLIAANRARWIDELRKQHSNSAHRRWSDPEQRKHASEAAKRRWNNPEQQQMKKTVNGKTVVKSIVPCEIV